MGLYFSILAATDLPNKNNIYIKMDKLLDRIKEGEFNRELSVIAIALLVIAGGIGYAVMYEDVTLPGDQAIGITETSEGVTVSLSASDDIDGVEIQSPSGETVDTLSEPGEKVAVNRTDEGVEYGEYTVRDMADSEILNTFIIDEPADERSVTVTVMDMNDEPIENATVEADGQSEQTDPTGDAVLQDMPIGEHEFTADAEGYVSHTADIEVSEEGQSVAVTLVENDE